MRRPINRAYATKRRANNLSPDIVTFGAPCRDDELREHLDSFLASVDPATIAAEDPVSLVRLYDDPHDREVAGFLVAMLAYGRVASIKASAGRALAALGPHPARAVDAGRRSRKLDGFVYRFQKNDDVVRFLTAVRRVRKRYGSLGAAFLDADEPDNDYAKTMARFVDRLVAAIDGEPSNGLKFLLPNPGRGGAAKRLCLYLRWMIRDDDGADLGSWNTLAPGVDRSRLLIPLDTHIARIARYLGLTDRKSDDLVTAQQITSALVRLRPHDPLAYDLALCHLGIGGQCPRQRDVVLCRACPIQPVCRLGPEPAGWRGSEVE